MKNSNKIYESNQEVFDTIWQMFIVEDKPLNEYCAFSHKPHGCFIGSLLQAETAEDLQAASSILITFRIDHFLLIRETKITVIKTVQEIFMNCNPDFLYLLQCIHDKANILVYGKSIVKAELEILAKGYELTIGE